MEIKIKSPEYSTCTRRTDLHLTSGVHQHLIGRRHLVSSARWPPHPKQGWSDCLSVGTRQKTVSGPWPRAVSCLWTNNGSWTTGTQRPTESVRRLTVDISINGRMRRRVQRRRASKDVGEADGDLDRRPRPRGGVDRSPLFCPVLTRDVSLHFFTTHGGSRIESDRKYVTTHSRIVVNTFRDNF